jgi:hypothetical protein
MDNICPALCIEWDYQSGELYERKKLEQLGFLLPTRRTEVLLSAFVIANNRQYHMGIST